jgi:predicted glycogen debranching enzyme
VIAENTSEWLEADGTGGFASGTVNGIRTRRYHGLLLTATTPPTGRVMLVNGYDAWIESPAGRTDLTAQRYQGEVIHPHGHRAITGFSADPWPTWRHALADGIEIVTEILATPPASRTIVRWSLSRPVAGAVLHVRPFLSGRDYHSLQHENPSFDFKTRQEGGHLSWKPYAHTPAILSATNGAWRDEPQWYRNFLYAIERERGLDDAEDLASPGVLTFDLSRGPAVWVIGTGPDVADLPSGDALAAAIESAAVDPERQRRRRFSNRLERAADAYIVQRGIGKTIVAGYPWFTDWGRDTFIALRGLCLASGRLAEARDILLEWSNTVSEGMLPNRFPDAGEAPEYNAIDASLWYIVSTSELLDAATSRPELLSRLDRHRLETVVVTVLEGLAKGTRYGIRADADGLLACGVAGVQLTWMDARVGDRVVTPRVGKPVEVQALWINALEAGARLSTRWGPVLTRARASFERRFWNEEVGGLYDVIDVDHVKGTTDPAIRPNQIFAVGGLPYAAVSGERARHVVDLVELELLTPVGLRTLSPRASEYVGRYVGGPSVRDACYHQGTAWPWLLGAFVDAWIRVRGQSEAVKQEARRRFFEPLLQHLDDAGLGHVSEIADADPPHTPRGCPFQAWSVGEAIRIDLMTRT